MSLYQCEECGALENTALGWFWCRNLESAKPQFKGRALCSECGPDQKWHGRFDKLLLPKGMFVTNSDGNLAHRETGDTNVRKYEVKQ